MPSRSATVSYGSSPVSTSPINSSVPRDISDSPKESDLPSDTESPYSSSPAANSPRETELQVDNNNNNAWMTQPTAVKDTLAVPERTYRGTMLFLSRPRALSASVDPSYFADPSIVE